MALQSADGAGPRKKKALYLVEMKISRLVCLLRQLSDCPKNQVSQNGIKAWSLSAVQRCSRVPLLQSIRQQA